jgi:hypothetical protein
VLLSPQISIEGVSMEKEHLDLVAATLTANTPGV